MRWSNLNRWIAVILLAAPSILSAAETVPVHTELELMPTITHGWTQSDKEDVTGEVLTRLDEILQVHYKHWDFLPIDGEKESAVLAITTAKGGEDEILIKIFLKILDVDGYVLTELAATELYQPGHFAANGRPSPSSAEYLILNKLEYLLTTEKTRILQVLQEKVPLAVALEEEKIQAPDRIAALPLPKDRFAYLYKSIFLVQCSRQPECLLEVTGKDRWGPFSREIPLALIVEFNEDIPDEQLTDLVPFMIFLKEEVRKPQYTTFMPGGSQ